MLEIPFNYIQGEECHVFILVTDPSLFTWSFIFVLAPLPSHRLNLVKCPSIQSGVSWHGTGTGGGVVVSGIQSGPKWEQVCEWAQYKLEGTL